IGRVIAGAPRSAVYVVLAAALAIPTAEVALRWIHLRPTEWLLPAEEPQRQPDARLGWVLVPGRTRRSPVGGRSVEYPIDAAGYRVARVDAPVDPDRPPIVCAGESVMFGEGLTCAESIPAQVGTMLGIQSANLAVHGFSSDQAFVRIENELPHFRRPVAV